MNVLIRGTNLEDLQRALLMFSGHEIIELPDHERLKGKWTAVFIEYTNGTTGVRAECPFCKERQLTRTSFCPNCGADLREPATLCDGCERKNDSGCTYCARMGGE